jgi:hypothetical protein
MYMLPLCVACAAVLPYEKSPIDEADTMSKVDRPLKRGFLGADCNAWMVAPMVGLALCSCSVHIDLSACSCLEAVF